METGVDGLMVPVYERLDKIAIKGLAFAVSEYAPLAQIGNTEREKVVFHPRYSRNAGSDVVVYRLADCANDKTACELEGSLQTMKCFPRMYVYHINDVRTHNVEFCFIFSLITRCVFSSANHS